MEIAKTIKKMRIYVQNIIKFMNIIALIVIKIIAVNV